MKRHHIILGTKTTAGGEVISANSTRSLDGVKFRARRRQDLLPGVQIGGRHSLQRPPASRALERNCLCARA